MLKNERASHKIITVQWVTCYWLSRSLSFIFNEMQ